MQQTIQITHIGLIALALLCLSLSLIHAKRLSPLIYQANLDSSKWIFSEKLGFCELKHDIPNYGSAVFEMRTGRLQSFRLNTMVGPSKQESVMLKTGSPGWRPAAPLVIAEQPKMQQGYQPFEFDTMVVRRMLNSLMQGFAPEFRYQSWLGNQQPVQVKILPVKFTENYEKYLACSEKILPFTFADIKNTVIYFGVNDKRILKQERYKLKRIKDYFEVMKPKIRKIVIKGYADYAGNYLYNKYLSIDRAKALRKYIIDEVKFDPKKMVVRAYGVGRAVANNRTSTGRALNRRATIDIYLEDP